MGTKINLIRDKMTTSIITYMTLIICSFVSCADFNPEASTQENPSNGSGAPEANYPNLTDEEQRDLTECSFNGLHEKVKDFNPEKLRDLSVLIKNTTNYVGEECVSKMDKYAKINEENKAALNALKEKYSDPGAQEDDDYEVGEGETQKLIDKWGDLAQKNCCVNSLLCTCKNANEQQEGIEGEGEQRDGFEYEGEQS